jgi:peptide/nickel transport system substrate-binding protein
MRRFRTLLQIVVMGMALAYASGVFYAQTTLTRIVYGLTLSVSGIDPHINQSSELGIVLRQVYDTLLYRDPVSKEFVGGLAESWDISADGLIYTFRLKSGVTFHDGTPFNADAVARNFDRILDPNLNSQKAKPLLGTLVSYAIVDDLTLQMVLSAPFSPLLDSLSQVYLGIASPTALQQYQDDPSLYQFHQIGTGPFMFMEYLPEERIVLKRNPNYTWKPAFYGDLPENAIEEIEFRWYRDPATRLIALQTGEVQVMGEILPTDAQLIANDTSVKLVPVGIPGQPSQFYMNTAKSPTDRLEFRQALLYATNRNAIVESVFRGFSPVAWGPLTSYTEFYNSGVFGAYNYDATLAQQLLASLGYVDTDADGVLDLNGEKLSITVVQPPWGLVPQVTQLLQDQWRSIGIEVVVVPVAGFTALLEQVQSGNYNLVEFETSGFDPAFLSNRFQTGGVSNWTGIANSQLDTLLASGVQTTDATIRLQAYGEIQNLIMQEALVLPIRDIVNINGYSAKLSGLLYDPYGWFPLLYGVAYTD